MIATYLDLLPGFTPHQIEGLLHKLNEVSITAVSEILSGKTASEYIISYSSGIDSSILAVTTSHLTEDIVSLFSVGKIGSHDALELSGLQSSVFGAKTCLVQRLVTRENIEDATKQVSKIVDPSSSSISHFEDCIAFWLIGEELRKSKPGTRYIATANGPDELFCGYDRYRRILDSQGPEAVEFEIIRALKEARALKEKVKGVLAHYGLVTLDPFLFEDFVRFGVEVPLGAKLLQGNDRLRKRVWRAYGRQLGLEEATVLKPKKAMQYSMGLHTTINRMIKGGTVKIRN
ncbi:MAG: asparagine synthase C-terminal domain-containing protein [Nitrososphaerales archaeon]